MGLLRLVHIPAAQCFEVRRSHTDLVAGNAKGEVILFEPSSSEHVSVHTIFDPITALAPASDCRNYAIGYALFFLRSSLFRLLTAADTRMDLSS